MNSIRQSCGLPATTTIEARYSGGTKVGKSRTETVSRRRKQLFQSCAGSPDNFIRAANNAPDANQFGLDDNLIVCRYFLLHQTLVVIFGSARLSGNGDGRNKAARNEGRWEMPASCAPMSAIGTKRTSPSAQHMSAVQPKADTHHCVAQFCQADPITALCDKHSTAPKIGGAEADRSYGNCYCYLQNGLSALETVRL